MQRLNGKLMLQKVPKAAQIWSLKLLAVGMLLVSMGEHAPASAQTNGAFGRIAAVVNERVISRQDLSARINLLLATSGRKATPEIRRRLAGGVLRTLIDEELKLQEAGRLGIEINAVDLKQAWANVARRNNTSVNVLREKLARQRVQLSTIDRQLQAEIVWSRLVAAKFRNQTQVSNADVDAAVSLFNANLSKPQALLSEILLPVADPEDEAGVKQNADLLVRQLRDGSDFAGTAREHSQGPTAADGGSLGWLASQRLHPRLDAAATALEIGEISAPIRTVLGYHILRLDDRQVRDGARPLLDKVTLAQLFVPLPATADAATKSRQRDIADTASQTAKSCDDSRQRAIEIKSPASPDLGTLVVGELAPKLRDKIVDLKPGSASAPIKMPTGLMVLMICDRQTNKPKIPSRAQFRQRLENERLQNYARQYLMDLRRIATIDRRV